MPENNNYQGAVPSDHLKTDAFKFGNTMWDSDPNYKGPAPTQDQTNHYVYLNTLLRQNPGARPGGSAYQAPNYNVGAPSQSYSTGNFGQPQSKEGLLAGYLDQSLSDTRALQTDPIPESGVGSGTGSDVFDPNLVSDPDVVTDPEGPST